MQFKKLYFALLVLITFSIAHVYSQDKKYTVTVWNDRSIQLYQEICQINQDSVHFFVNKLVGSIDKKLIAENKEYEWGYQYGDSNDYFYVYIGDTIIKKTIKLPYPLMYLQPNFLYLKNDSVWNQKVMIDSLLSGKWFKCASQKGYCRIDMEKSIRNYRVDGALINYNKDGSFSWIQIFKNGVQKEYYKFYDPKSKNVLTGIFIRDDESIKHGLDIDFKNGQLKDIERYGDNEPYSIQFDSTGRVRDSVLFKQ